MDQRTLTSTDKLILIVGCGYTGLELAQRLTFKGIPVVGSTRSVERASVIRTRGAAVVMMDMSDLSPLKKVRGRLKAIVHMAPPIKQEDGSYADHTKDLLEWAKNEQLERFIYVSSTSVYGSHGGAMVDEHSPCEPDSPRGAKRLEIEKQVLSADLPSLVVRPAGIYGAGRSMLHRLAAGRYRLVGGGHAFTNRIHVKDLAALLEAALVRGEKGSVYLGCDEHPTTQKELVEALIEEFQIPHPPECTLEEAAIRMPIDVLKMVTGSKRLNSEWTRGSLNVRLRYPDFLSGCRDIWRSEQASIRALWGEGKS
jgi:nucleoside-diphosphate-sugar epimerase